MAYQTKNINPIDLKPQVAVGVSIPFNGPAVFNSTYTTKEQLKSNLINFFLTGRNERVFNFIGADLRKILFEQITDGEIDTLKETIESQTRRTFPNVQIDNIEVLTNPDENSIFISVKYSVPNLNITDELQINFEN